METTPFHVVDRDDYLTAVRETHEDNEIEQLLQQIRVLEEQIAETEKALAETQTPQ
jgi:hypothetical protein